MLHNSLERATCAHRLAVAVAVLCLSVPAAAQSSAVLPSVDCVEETEDGQFRAYFGYESTAAERLDVPLGRDNRFQGGRTGDEPLAAFDPGENRYAFAAVFANRLTWSIRTDGTKRMVRADQRHPLFNQCAPPVDNPEIEEGSPGDLSVDGLSETQFNSAGVVAVSFSLAGASFSDDPVDLLVVANDEYVSPTALSPQLATFDLVLVSGLNELAFYGADASGLPVTERYTVWAGSETQTVRVVDEQGAPVDGARVRFAIVDDLDVGEAGVTSGGQVTFFNVPPRTLIASAEDDLNRFGTAGALGDGSTVTVEVLGFLAPSDIANNDFSSGTAGWDVTTGISGGVVEIVDHVEDVGPSSEASFKTGPFGSSVQSMDGNSDLLIGTGGEGPQRVSRAFAVAAGTASVTVRYRFVTSEVPGGYFGSEFNDYFGVTVRTQAGGGRASEAASMNGLGLGAFSSDGATGWREVSIPVSEAGDVVQVDALVANVGDGAFGSQVILDVVQEGTLSVTQATLRDRTPALGPLTYLSLGAHPYKGGVTQVWGTVEVRGTPDDRLDDLILTVTGGPGVTVAFGSLSAAAQAALPSSFGADGVIRLSMTGAAPLFEIPASDFFNSVSEERLDLKVFAYAASGADAERAAGTAYGLRYYDGANRFSRSGDPRDAGVGGDSWAQPSMYAFTQAILEDPASADFMFNDFANMNGGPFPPHSGHQNGYEVDTATPRINAGTRDAVSAQRLVDFLNGPYGSGVETIGITYTSAVTAALSGTTLSDGRSARSVVRNWSGHTHHFHMNLRKSWTPGAQKMASSATDGASWTARGPRHAQSAEVAKAGDAPAAQFSTAVVPNPAFGATATLRISLPRSTDVRVSVFDATGRRVGSVSERSLSLGINDLSLATAGLATGIYVAVVETSDGAVSRTRFTVIR